MKLRKNLLRFAWFSKEGGGGATIGTQRNGPGKEVSYLASWLIHQFSIVRATEAVLSLSPR